MKTQSPAIGPTTGEDKKVFGTEPRGGGRARPGVSAGGQPAAIWAVLAFALVAYTALAFGYATLTPIWQNPDEPAHYNYVAYVARTGGLPTLQPGDWDAALLERLKNGRLQPADSVASIRYESWQPPLFYLAAAPLFQLGPTHDTLLEVWRLRAFDALLGGLTLGVAYVIAREVLAPQLAVAVPLVIAGVPMFTAVSAAISVDPLANLLAAIMLLVLLRRWRRDPNGRVGVIWAIGTGVLLGLALLTKLALGIFVPLAVLSAMRHSAHPIRQSALVLGAAGIVALPWLIHQVTSYGWADPFATSRHAAVVLDQPRFPGLSLAFVAAFLATTFHSFWAQFGWMGILAPDRLYWTWGVAVVVAAGGLILEWRWLCARAAWRLLLATMALAVFAYLGYNLTFEQFQGRYLFTALVPIAALLVLGWARWLPAPVKPWGIVLIGVSLIGLNAYALMRVLVPGFAPTG